MNPYIKTLNLKLDHDHLRKLALTTLKENSIIDTRKARNYADNDQYLSKIRLAFPCLSPIYNILCLKPNQGIDVHIDNNRKCTLNIPLFNCENSVTSFYEDVDITKCTIEKSPQGYITYIKDNLKETFSFTIDQPIIFNTSIPHSVINNGISDRIIFNWSFDNIYSFEEACSFFNDDAVNALTPLKHSLNSSVHS